MNIYLIILTSWSELTVFWEWVTFSWFFMYLVLFYCMLHIIILFRLDSVTSKRKKRCVCVCVNVFVLAVKLIWLYSNFKLFLLGVGNSSKLSWFFFCPFWGTLCLWEKSQPETWAESTQEPKNALLYFAPSHNSLSRFWVAVFKYPKLWFMVHHPEIWLAFYNCFNHPVSCWNYSLLLG